MYESSLTYAGLTIEQAQIYEILLKNGQLPAGKVAKKSTLKRGLVYKVLDQLADKGLIDKTEKEGRAAVFTPNHPLKLKEAVEKLIREAKDSELNIESVLPSLISDFNIISGRPGIIYLEGLDGVEKVADDSLSAKGEILQYVDVEALESNAPEVNRRYGSKRQKLNKQKRVIITDSEYNRNYLKKHGDKLLDVRLLPFEMKGFDSSLMIYDDKISYLTLDAKQKNGMIIQNPQAAKMHRFLFEFNWSVAKKYSST